MGSEDLELTLLLKKILPLISQLEQSSINALTQQRIDFSLMQALIARKQIQLWGPVLTILSLKSTIDQYTRTEPIRQPF